MAKIILVLLTTLRPTALSRNINKMYAKGKLLKITSYNQYGNQRQ